MNVDDHKYVISIVSQHIIRHKVKDNAEIDNEFIEQRLTKELSNYEYDVDREELLAELITSFQTMIGAATHLQSDKERDRPEAPWVTKRLTEGELNWQFWQDYRYYLLEDSWDAPVVSRLDSTTSEILDSMMPPDKAGAWDQRGLVVGHIQSGKTANYIGLICKAVDAGYKVIIILAGVHNNLRTQTQIRLEEGFLGYATMDEDFSKLTPIGVGTHRVKAQPLDTITTRGDNGDFKTSVARNFAINPGGNPLLFVVKKNTTVLRNLHNWVSSAAELQGKSRVANVPLLMIDDESDYASVDTGLQEFEGETPDPEHEPKAINRRIRSILNSFEQSVYIGYTATPFANIFIHERAETEEYGEDLFPRSFIFTLPLPSNYVGPDQMFGLDREDQDELPIFRTVSDHAESDDIQETEGWIPPKHTINHNPLYMGTPRVPPSLQKAIRSFIIAVAARKADGQTDAHNSMLVHVTRFVKVQGRVREQVENEFGHIRDRIIYGDGDRKSVYEELKKIWDEDFVPTSQQINAPDCREKSWNEVKGKLRDAVTSIAVREINGMSSDILEYIKRKNAGQAFDVIVIGGDKLSRGLTLEGLCVSYFLRHSKMYDTLMQMGRWFGYRPGYLDLCRIYTTAELQRWFRHISIAGEELRQDFNRMVVSGCTPREYGQRVLNHPLLMVTSPTKMRYTDRRMASFDGSSKETILFLRTPDIVESNYITLQKLIHDINHNAPRYQNGRQDSEKLIWSGVKSEWIIAFLNSYQGHPGVTKVRPEYLKKYIERQNARKMLTNWTVYIGQGIGQVFNLTEEIEANLVKRVWHKPPDPPDEDAAYRVRRLASPDDEFIDLSDDEYDDALDKTIRIWKATADDERSDTEPEKPMGPGIRFSRPPERGLLCIYPVGAEKVSGYPDIELPLTGFFVSFPGDPDAEPIEYTVNEVFRRQEKEGFWDE